MTLHNLADIPFLSRFASYDRVRILTQGDWNGYRIHCDAVLLAKGDDGFVLVTSKSCKGLSQTFLGPASEQCSSPRPIQLLEELCHIRLQGNDFAHVYLGKYL